MPSAVFQILPLAISLTTLGLVTWKLQFQRPAVPLAQARMHILYESNHGVHNLSSTSETVFATYTIPPEITNGEFHGQRRMITEEFMAGVNFETDSSTLLLEQFWNGVLVQRVFVTPGVDGAPKFAPDQNRPLDIRTQVRRESGSPSECALRNHSYWSSSFNGTTTFGHGDEASWGQTSVDISKGAKVEWKYRWSTEGCHFYFDHLKVVF